MYAVHRGDYAGEIHILVGESDTEYRFLAIPTMKAREISKRLFDHALKNKVIEYHKKIKKDYLEICQEQYKELKNEEEDINIDDYAIRTTKTNNSK